MTFTKRNDARVGIKKRLRAFAYIVPVQCLAIKSTFLRHINIANTLFVTDVTSRNVCHSQEKKPKRRRCHVVKEAR